MNKIITLAIANAFTSIGDAILESVGEAPPDNTTPPAGGEGATAAPRRGRPPKSAEASTPAPAAAAPAVDVEKERARLREIYMPQVDAGKGESVKAIISKYSPTGMDAMKASDFPAFEKDIQALLL